MSANVRLVRKVINQFEKLRSASRLMRARRLGVRVGRDCRFGAHVEINLGLYENHLGEISVGDQGWIGQGVILWAFGGRIRIGKSVYVGQYSVIYGHGN